MFTPVGIRIPDPPARSLVITPTTLSQLLYCCVSKFCYKYSLCILFPRILYTGVNFFMSMVEVPDEE